jgi:fatty acid desaturase
LEVDLSRDAKEQLQAREKAPARAWLMAIVGWFVPGGGHLLQGRWVRAILLGGSVWAAFLGGLWMGGHLFSVNGSEAGSSTLLQLPPMIANLGAGLLYVVCWFFGVGFADDPIHAARATYEYGNTFLLIAGLLNYLAMLDAFDISARRKA